LLALTYYDPRLKEPEFLKEFPDEIEFAERFSHRIQFDMRVTTKRGATFTMPIVKYEGLKNVDGLKKWLKGRYLKIKADTKDLPPVEDVTIEVDAFNMPELVNAFIEHLKGEGSGSVRPDIKVEAALKKVPFTIRYCEDLLDKTDKPILIYSDHTAPIEKIAEHFKTRALTGKVPAKARAAYAREFQDGNDIKDRILCASIGALKEGQDLYRAHHIVFNDICWVPGDLHQVINRVRALGQKETRFIHYIMGSPQDKTIKSAL
jgi:SNF2 family DNA or RNA helicase